MALDSVNEQQSRRASSGSGSETRTRVVHQLYPLQGNLKSRNGTWMSTFQRPEKVVECGSKQPRTQVGLVHGMARSLEADYVWTHGDFSCADGESLCSPWC